MKSFFYNLSCIIIYGLYICFLFFILYIGVSIGEQKQIKNNLIKNGYPVVLRISTNNGTTFCHCRK